jgi:very-short-patch-repair endonuclease
MPLDIVIAADSLLNLGMANRFQIDTILGATARGRRILKRVDGNAESGTETMLRLRLRASNVRFRTQVPITGVGRVDFVVGNRLVIEVDGQAWHDTASQFELDRERDARLVAQGYLVMRFSYRRVMSDMAEVERRILAVVRARDHVRRPRHDRIARNYG